MKRSIILSTIFVVLFQMLAFAEDKGHGIPPIPPPPIATQGEMESGTSTKSVTVTPLLVAQAIAALAGEGANGVTDTAYSAADNGDTVHAISRNALYDYLVHFDADSDGSFTDETWYTALQPKPAEGAFEDGDKTNLDALVTLSGVAASSENLGDFDGTTITSDGTIKAALQELETAVENISLTGYLQTTTDFTGGDILSGTYNTLQINEAGLDFTHISNINQIGDLTTLGLDNGGTYTNFGAAGDDSLNELFAAIDTALGSLGGGEVAISGTPAQYEFATWADATTIQGVAVTGSSVLCTDANGEPVACSNLTDDTIPTQASLAVDDLITLSGVAEGSVNLGTFTGDTISDSLTIKAALQELETAFEALPGGHDAVTLAAGTDALTLSGQEITVQAYVEDLAEFTDPNADRIWFFDDSASAFTGLVVSTGLTITNTNLTANINAVDTNELTLNAGSLGLANHATARAALGLAIGTNVQAYDADLATLAAPTANRMYYSNGSSAQTAVTLGANNTFLESNGATSAPAFRALTSDDLTDVASIGMLDENETITGNWVNTDNPWADNEVADDLTISGGTVDNSVIGGSTPAAGTFTTLSAGSTAFSVDASGNVIAAGYSVSQGTTGQKMYLLEATANGTDFRGFRVPDSLDTGFNFQIPTGAPSANSILLAAAPAGSGADAYSALSYATFSSEFSVSTTVSLASGQIDITDVSDATGTPSGSTFLAGDNSWKAVSAEAFGNDNEIQYNISDALTAEAAFTYDPAHNTLNITQNSTDPTFTTGDGTYAGMGHTPQVYVEGVLEVDGNSFFDGDLTVGGTLTATIAIGDIATAAGNNEFLITPDSDSGDTLVLQARDIDAAGWDNVITITNSNTPTLTIAADGGTSFSNGNITGVGSFTAGSATADSGPITLIQGAQTGDPQVILDLTADANGDFSITTDTGDIGLISAATIQLKASAEDLVLTATSNLMTISSTTGATVAITPATKITGVLTTGSNIELGNASDTTISRSAAGVLAVEGKVIPRIIVSGTKALATSEIASGACSAAQDGGTATGTATTDIIDWGFNADPTGITGFGPSADGGLFIYAYPTSDHVNFKVCNNTADAVTPGAMTLNWRVLR